MSGAYRESEDSESANQMPRGPSIHHHYGSIHIEQARNVNTGPNYGILNQHAVWGSQMPQVFSDALPQTLRPIPDATHTRDRRRSPPNSSCLPGTRKAVLRRIMGWAMDASFDDSGDRPEYFRSLPRLSQAMPMPRRSQHVLWLCGPAGDGKSAVSHAICEMLQDQGRLLASFFFFRGSQVRSRIARFIATLASQMVEVLPETAPLVAAALRVPHLQGSAATTLFHQLIIQPFQAVVIPARNPNSSGKRRRTPTNSSGPYTIVVDGFDECEDRDDVADFIDAVLKLFDELSDLPLRFLLVSRIEAHIQGRLAGREVHIENLHNHPAFDDIVMLANHTFKTAAKRDRVIRSFGREWPSETHIRKLIHQADNSFIFIRTLLNFILGLESSMDDGMTPMERFELSLGMNGLDSLYLDTLKRSQHIAHFVDVLFITASPTLVGGNKYPPPSISDVALLLNIPQPNVVNVLIPLQSIIYVPETDFTPVTPFHASFIDFVQDEERSGLIPSSQMERCRDNLCCRIIELNFLVPLDERKGLSQLYDPATAWMHLGSRLLKGPQLKCPITLFIDVALGLMPRRELEMRLAFFFSCEDAFRPSEQSRPWTNFHWHEPECFDPYAPYSGEDDKRSTASTNTLSDGLCWLTRNHFACARDKFSIQLHGKPSPPRDPSVSRCVVMHSMLGFMESLNPSIFEIPWIQHLTLAVVSPEIIPPLQRDIREPTTDTETLPAFLRSNYVPRVSPRECSFEIERHRLWRLGPGMQLAINALESRFPGLLATTPVCQSTPNSYSVTSKSKGPSIVDMVNVFRILFPPEVHGPLKRSVTLIIGTQDDPIVFKFAAHGAQSMNERDLRPWRRLHVQRCLMSGLRPEAAQD